MTPPLDPAGDPDRFDANAAAAAEPAPSVPLDPTADPDRFSPGYGGSGEGQTLTGLLGEGAQEEAREGMAWLFGLLAVIAFLFLVSLLVRIGH